MEVLFRRLNQGGVPSTRNSDLSANNGENEHGTAGLSIQASWLNHEIPDDVATEDMDSRTKHSSILVEPPKLSHRIVADSTGTCTSIHHGLLPRNYIMMIVV